VSFSGAGQGEQRLVGGGCLRKAQVRLQQPMQLLPDLLPPADMVVLQPANGVVETSIYDCLVSRLVMRHAARIEQPLDKFSEQRQPGRAGHARAAEEHHLPILVGLEQAVRDIGAIDDELHGRLKLGLGPGP